MHNHSNIKVRTATRADAESITTLINLAFRQAESFFVDEDRITLAEVAELLESGEFLVAEDEKDLVGCVYLEPRSERTYLGLLSVRPSHQQAGLGSLLMLASEDHCRSRKAEFIDIYVVNLRDDLTPFYKKRGFLETGTSPFPPEVLTKLPCHLIKMSKKL